MIGPYRYKTVWLQESFFASGNKATENIQEAINSHVEQGWELYECLPIATAFAWRWTILIFRRPSADRP